MRTFKDILTEWHEFPIPLKWRKGASDAKIFCPKCGREFIYYKDKTNCRHCGETIVKPSDAKIMYPYDIEDIEDQKDEDIDNNNLEIKQTNQRSI